LDPSVELQADLISDILKGCVFLELAVRGDMLDDSALV
jgi:hypothetical protein